MQTKAHKQLTQLRARVQDTIDRAYAARSQSGSRDERAALRPYATNQEQGQKFDDLIAAEYRQESRDRANVHDDYRVKDAGLLLVLGQIGQGSAIEPTVDAYLVIKRTAFEAQVIGWCARSSMPADLREQLRTLDYATYVNTGAIFGSPRW